MIYFAFIMAFAKQFVTTIEKIGKVELAKCLKKFSSLLARKTETTIKQVL